jgi:phosphoribosyl-AMP cyclohydrolase / phosphoribosyl-ATP pyrophosphohydrolase
MPTEATPAIRSSVEPAALDWSKGGGLLPVIVQDARNLRVLMLGYMNLDAFRATLQLGKVTFFSRSKQRLWTKGETTGHVLQVQAIPHGPTCHLQRPSCFAEAPSDFLSELDALVESRQRARPEGSYTTKLFDDGVRRIAQKVGEEGVEVALAGVAQDDAALLGEGADLLFHLTVLLRARGLSLADAVAVLRQRHQAAS